MTERLYYSDSYLREFEARVVERSGDLVYLDRSAFYPASGGQPYDTGTIAGVAVSEVFEDGERIAHRVDGPVEGETVACRIDWQRRFDHMQQHSGQHLLSAVFEAETGARTVSFHLGAECTTMDLEGGALDAAALRAVEERANAALWENRGITVSFEDAAAAAGLRKPAGRAGAIRVVTIEGLDRSACGGTHVRATGEIGSILLGRTERVRNTLRVEFVCGGRAVRRARADVDALAAVAHLFSCAPGDAPALAAARVEALRAAERQRRALENELAVYRGRELYDRTPPGPDGVRRVVERFATGALEERRALAQSFTARDGAVYVAAVETPPSVLLAVSADAGIDAGRQLKAALQAAGGRGGGSSRMAQGSLPDGAALQRVLDLF